MTARLLALIGLLAAATAQARSHDEVPIRRMAQGALPAAASPGEIAALLTGAHWQYLNPRKETSTWEWKELAFRSDGQLEITVDHVDVFETVPARSIEAWSIARTGTRAVVLIAGRRYRLAPCGEGDGWTCLWGPGL